MANPIPENALKIRNRAGTLFFWKEEGKGSAKCRLCELKIDKGSPRLCIKFYHIWDPSWEKSKRPSRYRSLTYYTHIDCFGFSGNPNSTVGCIECGRIKKIEWPRKDKETSFYHVRTTGKQNLACVCQHCVSNLSTYVLCKSCNAAVLKTYATLIIYKGRFFNPEKVEYSCLHCAKNMAAENKGEPITLWERDKYQRELKQIRREIEEYFE